MTSRGSWLRKALSVSSAMVCAVSLALCILLIGVRRAAGNQARVTELLTTAFVRSGVLTDILAPNLLKGFGGERALSALTEDEMREILRTLFPVEWQEAQAKKSASQAYEYLFGRGPETALAISLEEPRRLMAGQGGLRVAQIIVRSWPACAPEQIDAITRAGEIPLELFGCEPPEPAAARVLSAVAASLGHLAQTMPGQYQLGGDAGSGNALREVHAVLETLALGMVLAFLVSAAGLLFALAIAARSLKAILRWAGVSWMSAAVLAIALALVLLAARNRLPIGLGDASPALHNATAVVVRGLVGLAMGATFVVSSAVLVVGSVVTAVSFAMKDPANDQERPEEEQTRGAASEAAAPRPEIGGRATLPSPATASGAASDDDGERPRGLFG